MKRIWNQALLTQLLMLVAAMTLSQSLAGCRPCEDGCTSTPETPIQTTPTNPGDSPTPAPTSTPPPTPTPCTQEFYLDLDADGYGDDAVSASGCSAPDGYVEVAGDCNDKDKAINPGAQEICDPAPTDEDCNGLIDDADDGVDPSSQTMFYPDADADGYGAATPATLACVQPDGYSETSDDCKDDNNTVYPNADELCDELDNDCNAETVENCWDVAVWDESLWE